MEFLFVSQTAVFQPLSWKWPVQGVVVLAVALAVGAVSNALTWKVCMQASMDDVSGVTAYLSRVAMFQVQLATMTIVVFWMTWMLCTTVAHETVRVLPGVGIVFISTNSAGFKLCRFLAWENTGPVIINEVSPLIISAISKNEEASCARSSCYYAAQCSRGQSQSSSHSNAFKYHLPAHNNLFLQRS